MELHLFRHGQTNWNAERRVQGQSESQLDEQGQQQARALGERIRHLDFDQIYCSSSERTRQTAALAFAERDQDIIYLDSLREIRMGPWEGRLYDEIAESEPDSFRHFWQEPHLYDVDGAETFLQLQERALNAIEEFSERHTGERVALVSHGALIKSVLCRIAEQPLCDLWAPPKMHNCAHSIIVFEPGSKARITQYADEPHQSW